MNSSRRAQNARYADEQLALLAALDRGYRVPDDELRAIAGRLGLSHALPDPQTQLLPMPQSSRRGGQQDINGERNG